MTESKKDDSDRKRWLWLKRVLLILLAAALVLGAISVFVSNIRLSINLRLAGLYLAILDGILWLIFRKKLPAKSQERPEEPMEIPGMSEQEKKLSKFVLVLILIFLFFPAMLLLMFLPSLFLPI